MSNHTTSPTPRQPVRENQKELRALRARLIIRMPCAGKCGRWIESPEYRCFETIVVCPACRGTVAF